MNSAVNLPFTLLGIRDRSISGEIKSSLYCAVFFDLKFSTTDRECIAKQSNSMPYNVHSNSFTKASVHNIIQSVCLRNIQHSQICLKIIVFYSQRYGVWLSQAWDNDWEVFLFSSPQPHQVLLIHQTAIKTQPLSCVLMLIWSWYKNNLCQCCNTKKMRPQTVMRAIKFKMFGKIWGCIPDYCTEALMWIQEFSWTMWRLHGVKLR